MSPRKSGSGKPGASKPGQKKPARPGSKPGNKPSGKSGGKPGGKSGGKPRPSGKSGGRPSRREEAAHKSEEGLIDIRMKGMANGGSAMGIYQRRVVFIPYTIPGERLKARIVHSEKQVDFAEGVQLLDASGDRVFPRCQHFGPGGCWGCQWQHISYKAQLLLKQDVLVDQLQRMGGFDDDTLEQAIRPVIAAPQEWGYNYQISYDRSPDGLLGLARADGRSLEAIQLCEVLHPELQALYESVEMDFPDLARLTLMRGSSGETMIILSMRSEDAPELMADFPTSVNVLLPDNEPVNLMGDSLLRYEIGGRSFRVTAGSFFRANVAQVDALVPAMLDLLRPASHEAILDLYAGVGVFSAFISPRAALVTLVESYPPAVTDADDNLSDLDNVDVVEGAVEEVLESLIESEESYDAAVLDPPSHGLGRDVIGQMLNLGVKRLVYISSNPASLGRDGRKLTEAGFRLKRLQPIDFAPQTYYIDALALFERSV